jgi:hypothetical protein
MEDLPVTNRRASCCCGQLTIACTGEPIRVSMCHCLACQQRTGSAFGIQARFRREDLVIAGRTSEYVRTGDEGGQARFRFCPDCGSTVYWDFSGGEGFVAVTVGAFADPDFPPPSFSVYAVRRHNWVCIPPSVVESWD